MKKRGKTRKLREKKLSATRKANGELIIDYNPKNPPQILFDTNVLLGLNPEGINALKKLRINRRFTYRYSMLNFVELASHLGDEPNSKTRDPFRKYQTAFKKIVLNFDLNPLPSPEMVFMKAVGLYHYLGSDWMLKKERWANTLIVIANATNLSELRAKNFSPEHYKKLRTEDGKIFLRFIEEAKSIGRLPSKLDPLKKEWGTFLMQFYNFLIYRASMEKKTFSSLGTGEQKKVVRFFSGLGGQMFLNHFVHLLNQTLQDRRNEDSNDFYDMLQLLLLRDEKLLFVTDDRPFHQYYGGPEQHRVISWKLFKASASLP